MNHGVINLPYGYTPILADYLFCWGNSQKNQLVKMGANQDTIIITGAQHICPTILADKKSSREKLFVTSDHTIVLLATNPVSKDNRKKLVKSFCESLYENSKIEMAIRLHPSEKLDFYHEEIDRFPRVRFLTNKELSLDESLAASDIVVCHDSGFGLDAIIKGKTVIILDVLDTPLKFGKELVELAGCPRARSKDELAMLIKKLISDESYLNSIRLDVEKYLRENFSVFGIDAATNVAREINNITVNHQALSLG